MEEILVKKQEAGNEWWSWLIYVREKAKQKGVGAVSWRPAPTVNISAFTLLEPYNS